MLGMYYYGLFGIQYEHNNLVFAPCVPKAFAGSHWLTNLRIRDMELNIHINGYGTDICSAMINGKAASPIIPLDYKGRLQLEIELMPQDEEEEPHYPVAQEDLPEPLWDAPTPTRLSWHPVDGAEAYYIYANGTAVGSALDCHFTPPKNNLLFNSYRVQAVAGNRTSGFSQAFDCPAPGTLRLLQPVRIGQEAEYSVENEQAWLDTRPCTSLLHYEETETEAGTYAIRIQYSNATASKRDGDTCALRELLADGEVVAVLPFPHNTEEGRWEDFSHTAAVRVELTAGVHQFSLRYRQDSCANTNGTLNQCLVKALEIRKEV